MFFAYCSRMRQSSTQVYSPQPATAQRLACMNEELVVRWAEDRLRFWLISCIRTGVPQLDIWNVAFHGSRPGG